ncbi:lysophospholipase L1-like esterase [Kribbella orskensis]|uniref:Lysophospholipase L1-like esterase n=1 Tax=Kribbella orskensis TaxID=2512216 RepID=A0ABY2BB98_9ACTN|nr:MULTISPECIES: SGNH/GDSL hydrolase family protein [Kribbella]TCN34679.1 lysophospholipase L1-like esterase [Kribbella sp. VKM Ac-2500]TCO14889.1 lysophospholipase L1-like esterase [Kribbella orskensis]
MNNHSRTARCAVAALALVAPLVLGVTTASAAPRQPVEYDALGDSYASGYGVPPYEACGRSQSAYAVQLNGRMKIDLDDVVACAGATTASLVAGGQLNALDDDTDLVTISIGGNDIGWSTAVVACLGGTDAQCAGGLAATSGRVTTVLPGLLDSVYSQVSARAPEAHVVVTGYPRLFSPEYGAFLAVSAPEQEALNDGADLLNGVIAEAAAEHGFQFVDVTKRFLGHGVNAPDAWVLGPFDPGAFHPNTAGYEAYTAALTASINPSRLR